MTENGGGLFAEEITKTQAGEDARNGSRRGGSLPEHAQKKHGKNAGADEARVFLDVGEPARAADAQYVFPGKGNGIHHREQRMARPIQTVFFSSASLLINLLYMSRVKMVEILLAFPASEATIAAVSAAMDKPFNPGGRNPSTEE